MIATSAANEWLNDLMLRYVAAAHDRVADNYDAHRYSIGGVDHSEDFWTAYHRDYLLFVVRHYERLWQSRMRLEDERSRALFDEMRLYNLLGHHHVKLSTNTPEYWKIRDLGATIASEPSPLEMKTLFGDVRHFEIEASGETVRYEGQVSNILYGFHYRQYFFERGGVRIQPEPGDIAIDGGSCSGETALAFALAVGPRGRVLAFEPAASNLTLLHYNIGQNEWARNVEILPVGIDSTRRDGEAMDVQGSLNPGFRISDAPVATDTLDNVAERLALPSVDFIKLDIEGSELNALRGAEATLRRFRPKLAISLYHRKMDPIDIVGYLAELDLGYRFFLEHYTIHNEETVLYATAR